MAACGPWGSFQSPRRVRPGQFLLLPAVMSPEAPVGGSAELDAPPEAVEGNRILVVGFIDLLG